MIAKKDKNRDDFLPNTVELLAKRASYVCSNPDCRRMTLAPSEADTTKVEYCGIVAHITAAAEGGPRYDASLTPEQRSHCDNGIFLCGSCSLLIDKNKGIDYSVATLNTWKADHEAWVKEHLNKPFPGATVEANTGPTYNISSVNQVGGFTGVMNVENIHVATPGRKLSPDTITKLAATLSVAPKRKVRITYANVAEPIALMSQLKALFETVGWEVQAIADLAPTWAGLAIGMKATQGTAAPLDISALAFAMANGKVEAIPHDNKNIEDGQLVIRIGLPES